MYLLIPFWSIQRHNELEWYNGLLLFETGYVALPGCLYLMVIFLPLHSEHWDYRCTVPPQLL